MSHRERKGSRSAGCEQGQHLGVVATKVRYFGVKSAKVLLAVQMGPNLRFWACFKLA